MIKRRFVLIQGDHMALYLDGRKFATWKYWVDDGEKIADLVEKVRLNGDKA